MRVLHVGKFFPPHPGGIERCMAQLCAALASRGVPVAALAHAEPGHAGKTWSDPAGFDVTLAACQGQLLYAPVSPAFPFALGRVIERFRPDLIHLHVPNTSVFAALFVPAARRLPWVVHWHADIPLDSRRLALRAAYRLYRPWETAVLRRAVAVIATSAPYLESSSALAAWRAKTRVIPLGIASSGNDAFGPADASSDSLSLSRRRDPDGRMRLLTVGRLSYFKGIDVLLRALAQVPDVDLTIVGDGESRAALERLARDLGVAARVRFTGRIDMDAAGAAALAVEYKNADIFCLPSTDRAESFGLVLLEAMRARLPIIASDIPGSGVGFVVRDGSTGLLVAPGDVPAWVRALRQLSDDASLRTRFAAAGEQRWRDEFTLDRSADRLLELYHSLPAISQGRGTAMRAD
jgi:glycosyltransferase involved in cell wall biosynthesis